MDRLKKIFSISIVIGLICIVTVIQGHGFTLEECVDLALRNNPNLQQQKLNLELAHEDMTDRKSQNFGQLNVISSYTHYNLPHTLAPLTPASIMADPTAVPTTEDLFTAGLVYEVALFTGFTQTKAIQIAALQKEMAGVTLKLSREQLIYNVKTLYVDILSLRAQEEAQAAYVKALTYLHDDVSRQLKLGKKARIDQLKAAADLKNGHAGKSRITADIKIMKAALASLLNIDAVPELQPIDLSPESMVVIEDDFSDRIESLQRLRAAQLAVEKNTKLVEKANGSLYPQVVLNTGYGQNFGPNDSSNKNSGDWNHQEIWQAGVNLKWNILDFGGNRARVQKARALERQSRHEQTKTALELKRALLEAVTKIDTAVTDYNSAREELAMTRETEAIEQVRYEQGAADTGDLLNAKARSQLAQSRFINAGYSCKNAYFYLDYLLENGENR